MITTQHQNRIGIEPFNWLDKIGNYSFTIDRFKDIVENILLDNNFEIAIKTVVSNTSNIQNSTLRLKNLNSDFSQKYKEAITKSVKPVVMSGGIFSDLTTFQDGLGGELAEEGYDVWTIEMTGGPQIECDRNKV